MNRMRRTTGLILIALSFFASTVLQAEESITVMTHDSFDVSKEIIATFEKENKVKIRFLKSGDAGAALIQAILSKNNPLADVFFGVDNTFLSRALAADIYPGSGGSNPSELMVSNDTLYFRARDNRGTPDHRWSNPLRRFR